MRLKEPSPQFGGHFKERIELFGTHGTIQILPLERPSLRVYSDAGLLPDALQGWVAPTLAWTPYEERGLSLHFNADEDPWVPLHRHFFGWLRGEEPPASDGRFGRQIQSIVAAAYESARTGAVVRLPGG
jgi:predicted dehydrogenase